ncbi:c-type cytochrome [Shimia aestuarii]|uniref:Cytochrome c n=1 Tax=Shimia aestuarii TaxID=254406 RepID=A0A1I4K744_9RHOB|nr:cytochrome c [Shimia aestuarii]SFL74642.1 Cytochrome c [Shimia aestuarii]
MNWKILAIAGVVGVAGAISLAVMSDRETEAPAAAGSSDALARVTLPASLSDMGKIGEQIFTAKCSDCHGVNAVGVDGAGPPLIHKIYEPSHHGDEAFQRAVQLGVRSHHWSFGDMAPVEGLTRGDVAAIISYIREVQRANGIS